MGFQYNKGSDRSRVSSASQSERRGSSRFPIEQGLRYRVLNKRSNQESGVGTTINMSSSGILFSSEHALPPGRNIEIDVDWPAQLNNSTALKLVARGKVTRSNGLEAAVTIQHYEFRTKGSGNRIMVN
jgi:hypothetical protein